jgi:hypothetical protein
MGMAKKRTKKKTAKKTTTTIPKKSASKEHPAALPAAAAKAALDRATQDINKLQKGSSKNAWAIGRRLVQVADLELHKARGFARIDDYAEKQLKISADAAFGNAGGGKAVGHSDAEVSSAIRGRQGQRQQVVRAGYNRRPATRGRSRTSRSQEGREEGSASEVARGRGCHRDRQRQPSAR